MRNAEYIMYIQFFSSVPCTFFHGFFWNFFLNFVFILLLFALSVQLFKYVLTLHRGINKMYPPTKKKIYNIFIFEEEKIYIHIYIPITIKKKSIFPYSGFDRETLIWPLLHFILFREWNDIFVCYAGDRYSPSWPHVPVIIMCNHVTGTLRNYYSTHRQKTADPPP